jgi:peroxiredoxin
MSRAGLVALLKDWGLAALAVLVGLAVWNRLFSPVPQADGPAPPLDLPTIDGGRIDLATLGPGPVIVNFWFTTCPPCRQEIPELSRFAATHPDVTVLGVSVDRGMATDRLAAASKRLGVTYPVLHDRDATAAAAWGVSVFPTTFVVRDGALRKAVVGAVDGRRLEALVAEAP